jgi:beta-phosphoglucomutase-like phosphatase (HAD superfamily)
MTQPSAALDDILARTRHLLLDFNGPICDLYASLPASVMADQLRRHLHTQEVSVPVDVAHTDDPIEVLAYSASVSPVLAAEVEAELTNLEVTAATTAPLTAHLYDLLAECHSTGRTVAVVTDSSARAVRTYFAHHHLGDYIAHVIARTRPDPAFLQPSPRLIKQAVTALGAEPDTCTLVGRSTADVESARLAKVASIGYANRPGDHEQLTEAGALITCPFTGSRHADVAGSLNL